VLLLSGAATIMLYESSNSIIVQVFSLPVCVKRCRKQGNKNQCVTCIVYNFTTKLSAE
jgi:hypothetical protein